MKKTIKKLMHYRIREELKNWVLLLPVVLFYLFFLIYPAVYVLKLSFYSGMAGNLKFSGFLNYCHIFSNSTFWEVLVNTVAWVALTTTIKVGGGLGLALFLNREFPGKKLLMLVILLPWATPYVMSAIAWRWMYNPLYGQFNDLLLKLHLVKAPIAFLGTSSTALISVALTHAWTGIPFCALVFLSVLYTIPHTYYDAAAVDGANSIKIFRYITLPLLAPSLLMVTVLVSIWGFNAFGVIWTMTQGGPLQSSETLLTYTYRIYFIYMRYGEGSAVAVISLILLTLFSSVYIWLRRRVQFE